jgi:hypothetical protein
MQNSGKFPAGESSAQRNVVMIARKALASLAALGLIVTGVTASAPALAQEEEAADDVGLWLLGGFVISEVVLVAILKSEDDIELIPDPEPTPVTP